MKNIDITDLGFENKNFWISFFWVVWQNTYDEQEDKSVCDILDEYCHEMDDYFEWWREFTQYSDEIFEKSNGYLNEPTTLKAELEGGRILKIKFHPGDTIFFIDDKEIGCTGPDYVKVFTVPYRVVERLLHLEYGERLFFLLLPMAWIEEDEREEARWKIESLLHNIFAEEICGDIAKCIVWGLTKMEI